MIQKQKEGVDTLSKTELEVLTLLAKALTVKQVAQRLGLAYTTIKTHKERIMEKLGVTTIRKAVARLHQHRLEVSGQLIPVEESRAARVLSKRELEMLTLLAKYRTVARASREMGVAWTTGRTHCEHIRAKLGVRNLAGAIGALYQRA
jgi:DNA-binding NarL/FixJ family response regulator